jgi:hypothetical protein
MSSKKPGRRHELAQRVEQKSTAPAAKALGVLDEIAWRRDELHAGVK